MESNPVPSAEPKSNRNTILIVLGVALLCCCCIAAGVAVYYGYQAYVAAQQVVEDFETLDIPTDVPFVPEDPNGTPFAPGFDTSGNVPSGGLADDDTRLTAWALVQLSAILSGCSTPTVEGTTIDIIQQPDAGGVWREEWNVNCGDGTFQTFPLTFTPDNGIINVTVDVQP